MGDRSSVGPQTVVPTFTLNSAGVYAHSYGWRNGGSTILTSGPDALAGLTLDWATETADGAVDVTGLGTVKTVACGAVVGLGGRRDGVQPASVKAILASTRAISLGMVVAGH
jgi:hypothetical protein